MEAMDKLYISKDVMFIFLINYFIVGLSLIHI